MRIFAQSDPIKFLEIRQWWTHFMALNGFKSYRLIYNLKIKCILCIRRLYMLRGCYECHIKWDMYWWKKMPIFRQCHHHLPHNDAFLDLCLGMVGSTRRHMWSIYCGIDSSASPLKKSYRVAVHSSLSREVTSWMIHAQAVLAQPSWKYWWHRGTWCTLSTQEWTSDTSPQVGRFLGH
jgi:hypothetical protein